MPTFSAIALDRLLEPAASKLVDKSVGAMKPPYSKPPNSKQEERSNKTTVKNSLRPQMSPSLYTTPESTPLPDSPSSFPPSPYIINHKRRGPRLLKSFSVDDVSSRQKVLNSEKKNVDGTIVESKGAIKKSTSVTFSIPEPIHEEHAKVVPDRRIENDHVNGQNDAPAADRFVTNANAASIELQSNGMDLGSNNRVLGSYKENKNLARDTTALKPDSFNLDRDGQSEDFYDPQETMSFTSNTEVEDTTAGVESSLKLGIPAGEFYDAWEELSSDSGLQQTFAPNGEAELREIRLSLLSEIEKRKLAEEVLGRMRSHWQRITEQLTELGLELPADQLDINLAEELCHQFQVTRYVSESIGRGIVKAELEMEMEAQIESKNFEVARLTDRLQYYEAMNREMSQRNQEAIENARRERQRRKRKQKWVWGSIAAAITLGSAALAWSYFPSKGETSASAIISKGDEAAN